MDGLAGSTANSADRKALGDILDRAVVASCHTLLDDLHLTVESSGTTLYERYVGCKAHLVDMPSCINIIEGVEYQLEGGKPRHTEFGVFNVGMMRNNLDGRIEFLCHLFCDLDTSQFPRDICKTIRVGQHTNALDFLICSWRKRNWRFRLLKSIVSRSTTWISANPARTRFFRSSQPMPPAPTISTRACEIIVRRCSVQVALEGSQVVIFMSNLEVM